MRYQCYVAVEFELKAVLTMAEKVFLVEYYFRSYGDGCNDGPSIQQMSVRSRQQFNKAVHSKSMMVGVSSVFCQRNLNLRTFQFLE